MPGIFNIGNTYNVNNKKISNKLIFDTGDKFSARIIKKENSNIATIKLISGVELEAEIDGDINTVYNEFVRFRVENFEDGKLKLKIIKIDISEEEIKQDEFNDIIIKEGLKKEDINLLKDMTKFNIPLTKENIIELKGIIQFLDKIKENPKEIDEFISKYILSNNISKNDLEISRVDNILSEFLNDFKTLSKEDILLFFENEIDLNSETIKGFNSIFKNKNSIINNITLMNSSIREYLLENDKNIEENIESNINLKIIEESINDNTSINTKINTKIEDFLNSQLSKILSNENLSFTKKDIENLLSNFLGKSIKLTEDEFIKLKKGINFNYQEVINRENNSKMNLELEEEKINLSDKLYENDEKIVINKLSTKEIIKNSIDKIGENNKEVIKEIIKSITDDITPKDKILNIIKESIGEIKVFNKISSEYYYANIPINIKEREYPCKIIIKDKRKSGKIIDSKNVKIVITIDTNNLGIVDGYIKVLDKKIDIDLKCENKYVKAIDTSKNKLLDSIEKIGFFVDIKVSKREEDVFLSNCRDFFNSDSRIFIDKKV